METIKIAAEIRSNQGTKKELSGLRANAKIPGVVYGGSKPPIKVVLSERELLAARQKGGANVLLNLSLGQSSETVIIKELQRHPVSSRLWHADFQRISLTQKIEAKVPLHIKGEAPGVKLNGGVLEHELRELSVKALPAHIPHFLEVDISSLQIGMNIKVSGLSVPKDIEVLNHPDHLVVHVTLVKVIEAEVTPAAAAAAAAATDAAPAQPESSSTKGKKDEEGKVIPKAAVAPAPAEKGKEKKEGAK